MTTYDELAKAADFVSARLGRAPIGIVLGSGLSETLDSVDRPRFLDYTEIPGLPGTSIVGHRGALLHGHMGDVAILGLCGRVHLYEGRPIEEIVAPVRLLSMLGVHTLVVTSAVGSADPELLPGHVMAVEDHINLSGENVLAGESDNRFGSRFPDMTQAYDKTCIAIVEEVAALAGIPMRRGILAQFRGPSYETPAEVRMAKTLGARVVSMSMVPEVLAARQRGMRVLGLAAVTNLAAGLGLAALEHQDVLRSSATNAEILQNLLSGVVPRLAAMP